MEKFKNNHKKIEALLRYILYIASQESGWERKLGPIHLIKYVYLADLEHARNHNGVTYTGIRWQFYHYGPWDLGLYESIPEALNIPGVLAEQFESQYDKDFKRWSLESEDSICDIEDSIDLTVSGAMQKYVRKFSNATYDLLDFVYKTPPMLNAVPNEFLDFKVVIKIPQEDAIQHQEKMTVRQIKKRKATVEKYKLKIQDRIRKNKEKRRQFLRPKPRYDDVFKEGINWLESVANSEIGEIKGTVHFSKDIWKSEIRRDSDDTR